MHQSDPAGIHQSQGSLWSRCLGTNTSKFQQAPAGPEPRPGPDAVRAGTPLRAHPRVHHTILGQIVPLITRFSVSHLQRQFVAKTPPSFESNPSAPALPRGTIRIRLAADGLSNQRRLLVDVIGRRTHLERPAGVPAHSQPRPRRLSSSPRPRLHYHLPPGRANPPTQTRMQQLILSPPLAEPGQQRTQGGRHHGRPRR